jgi:protein phosphatase
MKVEFAALTDIGKKRDANEDFYYAEYPLFIVADGLGGHQAGEVASSTAVRIFSEKIRSIYSNALKPDELLEHMRKALLDADEAIYKAGRSSTELKGMGTTITAGCFLDKKLALAHIGDSRAYLLREEKLTKITTDHTYVQHLVDIGEIDEEEASVHPLRSALTQALGGEYKIKAQLKTINVKAGDIILFCTDGLYTMVSEERIKEILSESSKAEEKASKLVKEAIEAGGLDNITVIVIEIKNED